ncbi:hypothetical protein GKZ68_20055 [Hymenobacter sp. BRD128]|uniref:hypothetical protein n=1 Tax=Hymenobacter sp. BRD128 TaxID=2675878 RepID=UPI001566F294|nr:hypothetical protein [Hymenobacter sp. BRD128]QKG58723.1 hypothetical protein GKZ68_20055 [Hymenobacter sp. BRD128]
MLKNGFLATLKFNRVNYFAASTNFAINTWKYAQQMPAVEGFASMPLASTTTPDAIWQLYFSNTDQNL